MKLNIRTKLLGGFAVVLLLLGVIAWKSISDLGELSKNTDEMYNKHTVGLSHIMQANIDLVARGRAEKNMILAETDAEIIQHRDSMTKFLAAAREELEKLELVLVTEEGRRKAEAVIEEMDEVEKKQAEIAAAATAHNDVLARQKATELRALVNELDEQIGELQAQKLELAETAVHEADSTYASARRLLLILTGIAVAAGMGIGFWLSRNISTGVSAVAGSAKQIAERDLPEMVAAMEALANGDLTRDVRFETKPLDIKSSDEIGEMATSFSSMIGRLGEVSSAFGTAITNLRSLVGRVNESATAVASASGDLTSASGQAGQATTQVSTTIQDVARGASEQADAATRTTETIDSLAAATDQVAKGANDQVAALGQANATVGQIGEAIGGVADRSRQATDASAQALEAAKAGAAAVEKSVNSMVEIRQAVERTAERVGALGAKSEEIGNIVAVIDDIAEQTNLLALNAAIEAARAGEHGRGFVVVADEVRKLAERSGQATKEISDLIAGVQQGTQEAVQAMQQGVADAERGSELASEAGQSLTSILTSVEVSAAEVAQISDAATIVAKNAEELVKAIQSIAAVAEENSAAATQMRSGATQAAESMQSVAAVAEENSAATEEVSASTQELTAQIEEIAASASSLADLAGDLQKVVAQFKIDEGGSSARDGEPGWQEKVRSLRAA